MLETDALVRIQEIDLALMRHRRTLSAMPQTKKIQAIRQARKKLAQEATRVLGLRKDAEMDLADADHSHDRLVEIMVETQERAERPGVTYRELADIEAQLTSLAKRIEKYEFKRPSLVERLEKVRATERNVAETDRRLEEEEEAQTQSLNERAADIVQDMQRLTAERQTVAAAITSQVMESYVAAQRRFKGLAVEVLRNNIPSICCVTVPPSAYSDVVHGPAITECPYCHRLLVTSTSMDS